MHDLSDEKLNELLDAGPDTRTAIGELFEQAHAKCEDRFFLSILDIERFFVKDTPQPKHMLLVNMARGWVVSQIGRFLASVSQIPDSASKDEEELARYLQLLGYSQVWECIGIQRLIWSLVRTASGKEYDPRLLIGHNPRTANVITSIANEARTQGLSLAESLDAMYHNIIRNAFAHSDFLILNRAISTAPDITQRGKSFYIRFETWDRLFSTVIEFVKNLFMRRREAEALLTRQSPYTFSLAEFAGDFTLRRDEKNRWVFQR